jgi:hypothetical protein
MMTTTTTQSVTQRWKMLRLLENGLIITPSEKDKVRTCPPMTHKTIPKYTERGVELRVVPNQFITSATKKGTTVYETIVASPPPDFRTSTM